MRDHPIIKALLSPFSLLYGGITAIRNRFYDSGTFKSTSFDFPIISVGNISTGGTGKTPHILFLAEYLKEYIKVGILSRGYGRKTRGYLPVLITSSADAVGDEPLLFKWKMPEVAVTVCEQRVYGVPHLLQDYPETQLILLDDAFQHRAVKPSYNILLTECNKPYYEDMMLPAGNLRESKKGAQRADLIIVTKCPTSLSETDANHIKRQLAPTSSQQVFFSTIQYGRTYPLIRERPVPNFSKNTDVLLLCGIAKPGYIVNYLKDKVKQVHSFFLKDHHAFTHSDIRRLYSLFDEIENPQKLIITTEKDAVRLQPLKDLIVENKLPITVLPIEIDFLFDEKEAFLKKITSFLQEFEV